MQTENTPPIPTETDETPEGDVTTPEQDSEGLETFPAEVVRKLRKEAGDNRTRAKDAETRVSELEREVHRLLVEKTGKLADPADLPFDAEHIADPEKLSSAIESLIDAKPHLAARKVPENIGGGHKGKETYDLGAILRGMI